MIRFPGTIRLTGNSGWIERSLSPRQCEERSDKVVAVINGHSRPKDGVAFARLYPGDPDKPSTVFM